MAGESQPPELEKKSPLLQLAVEQKKFAATNRGCPAALRAALPAFAVPVFSRAKSNKKHQSPSGLRYRSALPQCCNRAAPAPIPCGGAIPPDPYGQLRV